ncbi:MAG: hypothetical protein IKJ17_03930 [Clostridia bacterium]|nr:hypothetical protein [Clostridia bacterium]
MRKYQNTSNVIADTKDYFRGYGQIGYSKYDNSTSSVEIGEGLRDLIYELSYLNSLYDRLEPQAYRAGAFEDAQELIPAVEKRIKLLEETKKKLENKREKAVILEEAEEVVNYPDFIEKAQYNEDAEDVGKHFWSVNSGNSAVDMGFLSEEQAENLPATRASETDRTYGDFVEALDYAALGGNVRTAWFMTPKEVGIYNYLTETRGGKYADKYFESIEQELNDRRTGWSTREAQRVANEDEFASSLATVVATPARDITALAGNVNDMIKTAQGKEISANDAFKQNNLATREIRGTVSEDMGWLGKKAYKFAMNAGDGLMRTASTKFLPAGNIINTGLSASSAMQDGIIDAKEIGMSDEGSLLYGGTMGGVDGLAGGLASVGGMLIKTPDTINNSIASHISARSRGGITNKIKENRLQNKKDELYSLVRGTDGENYVNNLFRSNSFRWMNDDDKIEVVSGLTDYCRGNISEDNMKNILQINLK